MRVALEGGNRQADFFQQCVSHLDAFAVVAADLVDQHRFQQNLAHGKAWIERGVGVLKDDLDAPLVWHKVAVRHGENILAFKDGLTRRRLMQAHQGQADRGLAGTRFAHHAQRFAACQCE